MRLRLPLLTVALTTSCLRPASSRLSAFVTPPAIFCPAHAPADPRSGAVQRVGESHRRAHSSGKLAAAKQPPGGLDPPERQQRARMPVGKPRARPASAAVVKEEGDEGQQPGGAPRGSPAGKASPRASPKKRARPPKTEESGAPDTPDGARAALERAAPDTPDGAAARWSSGSPVRGKSATPKASPRKATPKKAAPPPLEQRRSGAEDFWAPLEIAPTELRIDVAPPPRPPRTKWTRRVPHPVLIGHAASLTPY
jgi:hypothetical protein